MNRALVVTVLLAILLPWNLYGRDLVKEAKIESELEAINPALVAPFREARIALDKNDFAQAASLLEPICKAAPEFDAAERRLGISLAQIGRRLEGSYYAERAVAIRRTPANLSSLAAVLAFTSPGHTATAQEKERAFALLKESVKLPDGQEPEDLIALAYLSLEENDLLTLRTTIPLLQQRAPGEAVTHFFAAILAAHDENLPLAREEIATARERGLPDAEAQAFLARLDHPRRSTFGNIVVIAAWGIGIWAAGLALLCGLGFALSWLTLRQVERSRATAAVVNPGEHRLRRIYRWVLNVTGVYYYISLPVVLVVVVGLCGGILLFFMSIGTVPIKLVFILVIGAVMTIVSMVRSLFLRIPASDPGRVLERAEAEGLRRVTEEVAGEVKTRPVDEIRITEGADLCVYERGSWREKLGNRAKRVLVVGTALLPDFRQEDFRCVLAHEYGHFSHRDTAGGDVAMRVRSDMVKFYLAMRAAGQATSLNMAFQFLRVYNFIFRRISHGATRLQEVLADRAAAQIYGAAAFEGGLTHVIRQSVAFEQRANREIKSAIEGARPIQNLYSLECSEPAVEENGFQQAMERKTTEDDTHPGPKDRIRYVAGLPPRNAAPAHGLVWELFHDPQAIMREMVEKFEKMVEPHRQAQ